MSNKMDDIESLLFNYGSTHRADFKDPKTLQLLHATDTVKLDKGLRSSNAGKDSEKPSKEKRTSSLVTVVDTEAENERGRRALPRLVMPPAVDVDAIEDPHVRQILIKDVYTSSSRRSYNQPNTNNARAALPSRYTANNPVALPKLTPPYVAPEWRLESVGWDRRQKRASLERNKVFWLSKDIIEGADKLK